MSDKKRTALSERVRPITAFNEEMLGKDTAFQYVVSRKKMEELEQAVHDDKSDRLKHLTFDSMMENAGKTIEEYFAACYPKEHCNRVLVLCGKGKNGGDGFVIAQGLVKRKYDVVVLLVDGSPNGDMIQCAKLQDLCNAWKGADSYVLMPKQPQAFDGFWKREGLDKVSHVVDAVYGINFHGELAPMMGCITKALKTQDVTVMAVDLPSGQEADRHYVDRHLLPADRTVTITAPKPSLAVTDTEPARGKVFVADIGIPQDIVQKYGHPYVQIDKERVAACFKPRHPFAHKGECGRLLSLCGSYGMAGASMLAGRAALRSGVGLLQAAVPQSIYPIAAANLWEAVFTILPETVAGMLDPSPVLSQLKALSAGSEHKPTAVLAGCGLSQEPPLEPILEQWLPTVTCPLVLDADGLNFLSMHKDIARNIPGPLIITPHEGEAAKMLHVDVQEVRDDRLAAVRKLAVEYNAVAVLKGQGTLISSPDNPLIYVNTTGCSGMATGGSGDVLAGIIASFAAQGMSPLDAAVAGVHIHGLAGLRAARFKSNLSMLPQDLIERLPGVLSQFES